MHLSKVELRQIRDSITNPNLCLELLGLTIARETDKEIWFYSPFRDEKQASCAMRKGSLAWNDFGDTSKGGGPLELIKFVFD